MNQLLDSLMKGMANSLLLGSCNCLLVACASPTQNGQTQITVAAATSLSDAFIEIGNSFEANHRAIAVNFNFAASGTLQRQIERGAPADVFASAANQQMDALEEQDLLLAGSRQRFARNQVVVVVAGKTNSGIDELTDLENDSIQRIAIGNPATVPAGAYGKAVLESVNLYQSLSDAQKLVFGENVRQVLTYVEQGNAPVGIVYATDAAIAPKLEVAVRISPQRSGDIEYPIATVKQSQNPEAAQTFIDFVTSSQGQEILQSYGFLTQTTP
jgi:molybdate transport system substrate-binding protein